jgi:hypothetical protein
MKLRADWAAPVQVREKEYAAKFEPNSSSSDSKSDSMSRRLDSRSFKLDQSADFSDDLDF